ncbi:MAG: hypothetical protein GX801_00285 [Fibrobacter sp.]|nr:hypothetical protein [Fibrobacter sp.]
MLVSEITKLRKKVESKKSSKAFARYADYLLETDELDLALEILEKGLSIWQTYVPGLIIYAKALKQKDEVDLAIEHLEKILNVDPMHQMAMKWLYELFIKKGDKQQANFYGGQLNELDILGAQVDSNLLDAADSDSSVDLGAGGLGLISEDEQEALFASLDKVFIEDDDDLDDELSATDLQKSLESALKESMDSFTEDGEDDAALTDITSEKLSSAFDNLFEASDDDSSLSLDDSTDLVLDTGVGGEMDIEGLGFTDSEVALEASPFADDGDLSSSFDELFGSDDELESSEVMSDLSTESVSDIAEEDAEEITDSSEELGDLSLEDEASSDLSLELAGDLAIAPEESSVAAPELALESDAVESDSDLSDDVSTAFDELFGPDDELGAFGPDDEKKPETTEDVMLALADEETGEFQGATQTLAEIYFNQGLYSEALQMYDELISLEPENEATVARAEEIRKIIAEGDENA